MTGAVNSKQELVAQELARLAVLDRAGCLDLWKTWFGCEASRYLATDDFAGVNSHGLSRWSTCRLLDNRQGCLHRLIPDLDHS